MQGVRALHVLLRQLLDRLFVVMVVVVVIRCDIFTNVGAFVPLYIFTIVHLYYCAFVLLWICTIVVLWNFLLVGLTLLARASAGAAGLAVLGCGVGVIEVEHVTSICARRPARSLLPRPP